VAKLALEEFMRNANDRVNALDDIASAQRSFSMSTVETLVGGATFGFSAAVTIMSGGSLTPVTGIGLAGGGFLMVHGGVRVFDAGMAWGNAAKANETANTNLVAAWNALSVLP